jgi:hypothetical protein
MSVEFTAHNIRLDDGTLTKPEIGYTMDAYPWFVSARALLTSHFPGDKSRYRLADLGCLEGGYAVEFARLGFQVLGIEVRESNFAACRYVQANTSLPNLEFVRDDAWNIAKYGKFDVVFCCGLFYHLDRPRRFLEILAAITLRVLILQTHFAHCTGSLAAYLPLHVRQFFRKLWPRTSAAKYGLSRLTTHEGVPGRWYSEFPTESCFRDRERARWSAWDNRWAFWIQREYLLQAMHDVGFDAVLEQFDSLGPDLAGALTRGCYVTDSRGTFVGLKSPPTASADALPASATKA